ncbi:L-Ala-D/L-Glu epimerase [Aquisphaera giovannonii]|uniref:L-Ala-D/L-Glu epimerase n=1 Tax=Aquisphaera giovannonii TaxID=406548 RepID=A0A5B9W1Y5_9BACT|nr:enolase C-terminal domain-like protein [Aquisphaera giovannonii]QEH33990.1 L-Ala-D/L-Glu epimerase [Aquisphaera giovannonii]
MSSPSTRTSGPADPARPGLRIRRITLLRLAVPLKREIKHASHARSVSENLVVRVELAGGIVGHGEGVPRDYVTGETIESTFASLAPHDWARIVGSPADFAEAVRVIGSIRLPENEADPRGMAGNAARCALEIALLDAYGRAFGEPLGKAVELAGFSGLRRFAAVRDVRYGAAITAESFRKEIRSAVKFRIYGFRDVKAKVGVEGQDDARRLGWIRRILGRRVELRIDANEAWRAGELIERTDPLRRFSIAALEQPVPHAEVDALATLRPRIGMPVMLDESLCGYPDAERAVRDGTADILNVRLSKCGGILPSLRIIALAHRTGLDLQLGCHPGETAILSAAGRHVAGRVEGIRWVEGSYDRHILRENVAREDITFGYGGRATPLAGPGLGITIDPGAVDAMATERRELDYD